MTITEFLEARIAEDEAAVVRRGPYPHSWHGVDAAGTYKPGCPDCMGVAGKTRVLVECAAKRAVIADRKRIDRSANDDEWSMGYSDANYAALKAMTTVYMDHDDYLPEWSR